jgi:hypothetical protein
MIDEWRTERDLEGSDNHLIQLKINKAMPATGRRDFDMSKFLDGREVVSPMRRPRFTLQEDSWYSFLLGA